MIWNFLKQNKPLLLGSIFLFIFAFVFSNLVFAQMRPSKTNPNTVAPTRTLERMVQDAGGQEAWASKFSQRSLRDVPTDELIRGQEDASLPLQDRIAAQQEIRNRGINFILQPDERARISQAEPNENNGKVTKVTDEKKECNETSDGTATKCKNLPPNTKVAEITDKDGNKYKLECKNAKVTCPGLEKGAGVQTVSNEIVPAAKDGTEVDVRSAQLIKDPKTGQVEYKITDTKPEDLNQNGYQVKNEGKNGEQVIFS